MSEILTPQSHNSDIDNGLHGQDYINNIEKAHLMAVASDEMRTRAAESRKEASEYYEEHGEAIAQAEASLAATQARREALLGGKALSQDEQDVVYAATMSTSKYAGLNSGERIQSSVQVQYAERNLGNLTYPGETAERSATSADSDAEYIEQDIASQYENGARL